MARASCLPGSRARTLCWAKAFWAAACAASTCGGSLKRTQRLTSHRVRPWMTSLRTWRQLASLAAPTTSFAACMCSTRRMTATSRCFRRTRRRRQQRPLRRTIRVPTASRHARSLAPRSPRSLRASARVTRNQHRRRLHYGRRLRAGRRAGTLHWERMPRRRRRLAASMPRAVRGRRSLTSAPTCPPVAFRPHRNASACRHLR